MKWLKRYEQGLQGKNVVLFGATGGIGKELCRNILQLGGALTGVACPVFKASVHTVAKADLGIKC